MKKRRFFFHYNKKAKKMTIHFKNTCYIVDKIHCHPYCESKKNKRQPFIVMQGFAQQVIVDGNNEGTIL